MTEDLLTPSQFAKLARTTKRTVLWYDEQEVLHPHHVTDAGYRFYAPHQILDFQSISLMRKLGFSIAEIAVLLRDDHSMRNLFEQQRTVLERQVGQLQRMLADTDRYYQNLRTNGTLVRPQLKHVASFQMYYLAKHGPYARIKNYSDELYNEFAEIPTGTVWLTAFMEPTYQPAKADMKIGVVRRPGMRLKPGSKVQLQTIPAYDTLACVHVGSTTLLSLLWQELGKYRQKKHLVHNTTLPFADVEFYAPDPSGYADPEDSLTTELHLPVIRH